MLDILETLLEEAFDAVQRTQNRVERHLKFPETEHMINVAIGMRRAGKTYFLYQSIDKLLQTGVPKQQILMINFEDDRLLPMSAKEMGALLDGFYTLYPQNHQKCCYFFLDEVQNIPDWHRVVRRLYDSKNVRLYLTGSSAKLLSKEIATSLRGRSLSIEVWPYSFKEYLSAHKIKVATQPFGQKSFDIMRKHLLDYFSKGGFPAVQFMQTPEWRSTLQSYTDTVILRDIIERYKISNVDLLRYLSITLIKNAAAPFSVNKFYNDIKSQGYRISKQTLYTYIEYLEDAFLLFNVPLYSESERKKHNQPKKIYTIDNGLVHANSLGIDQIFNKFLENQVYLDLRRSGKQVFFYKTKNNYEVDFVTISHNGTREIIQVTWDMDDPDTAAREQRALIQAQEELGITGRIITLKSYLRDHCCHDDSELL